MSKDKMKEEASNLQYSVTPKVLEMHAGKVKYEIKGDIPAEWFNKKAIVEFTPVYKYEGGEEVLESKTYQGVMRMKSMEKQKVVIIGGSSGIGLATAQGAVKLGAHVIIAARTAERLEHARQIIGHSVETAILDMSQEDQVQSFF